MPALYALAQHDALVSANGNMLPTERIFSFLDDLYVVTCRTRAAEAFQEVATAVQAMAGVRTHLGKLRAWSAGGGPAPGGIAALGVDVWTADKDDIENGLKILGSPLGKDAYVRRFSEDRMAKEVAYLEMVSKMPDL